MQPNLTMALTYDQPLLSSQKKFYPCKFLFMFILSLTIIGSIVSLTTNFINPNGSLSLARVCTGAHDPTSCQVMMSEFLSQNSRLNLDGMDLLKIFLRQSVPSIQGMAQRARDFTRRINNPNHLAAMADCMQLMDISMDRVMDSISALGNMTREAHSDAHTWLSGVLTNHFTCMEGLSGSARFMLEPDLKLLIDRARNSLALMVALSLSPQVHEVIGPVRGEFPAWVTMRDRWLLEVRGKAINANAVVAKDGSGNFKTIKEAIASAPDKSRNRYVIWVKKGIYKENVEIGSNKLNVMLTGDGMSQTIITGSLNVVDGATTFKSATVAAVGDGFIAQDIWFQNTAGPQKHQAVALRVGADQSVINRCRIDAFQDTLYTHTNRQFYRDCYITGTVDFIFGNAAVVFQNCKIVARKPMTGQNNMVTAQGREDPNQNTGTSIQKCNVIASSDLEPVKKTMKTYLGRPWKQYSRTVVMQSYIGDHVDPSGWSIWTGDFALKTLYYGEYMNNGPGASTSRRVKWAGYRVITNAAEANKFTVNGLIQGNVWLKNTGVTYAEGL